MWQGVKCLRKVHRYNSDNIVLIKFVPPLFCEAEKSSISSVIFPVRKIHVREKYPRNNDWFWSGLAFEGQQNISADSLLALSGMSSQPVALFVLAFNRETVTSLLFTSTRFVFFKDKGCLGIKFCCIWERLGVGFTRQVPCSVVPKLVKKLFRWFKPPQSLLPLMIVSLSSKTMRPFWLLLPELM